MQLQIDSLYQIYNKNNEKIKKYEILNHYIQIVANDETTTNASKYK